MSDITLPYGYILSKVHVIRWIKVMLDRDLADLYWVETKRINEAVKRNMDRFPEDFMFQLSDQEFENWKSQFATSNSGDKMWWRKKPFVFTEHGILMLSSVLRSSQAIQTNISIIRVFNQMRKMMLSQEKLRERLESMEQQTLANHQDIQELRFEFKKIFLCEVDESERPIGFRVSD